MNVNFSKTTKRIILAAGAISCAITGSASAQIGPAWTQIQPIAPMQPISPMPYYSPPSYGAPTTTTVMPLGGGFYSFQGSNGGGGMITPLGNGMYTVTTRPGW